MGMTLTKEFVNNCRNVGVLRDFLCQAIDQVDEKDKEIAELKADYKEACGRLQTANLIKDEQLAAARHSKRKRCLAMARWCNERIVRIEKDYAFWRYGKDYAQNFYKKWKLRWLELAEKFKEEAK